MADSDTAQSDALLRRDGWTRRFTAVGPRLNEAIDLYRGLGFEICLEPAEPGAETVAERSSCDQCFVMTLARTIYTRPLIVDTGAHVAER